MADLRVRLASALVLGPLVLAAVWLGGWPFLLLAAAAAAVIAWEWMLIVRGRGSDAAALCAIVAAALCVLLAGAGWWLAALGVVAAGAVGSQVLAGRGAALAWAAPVYAGPPLAALWVLRADGEAGLLAVLWLLVIVWATDIGAYFAGRTIGGPKLWPRVSPKKTWAGSIGGAVASVICAAVVLAVAGQGTSLAVLVLAALLSLVSQVGDLAESALKRRFGAKDSSRLIPGHGGVMDRMDGLLAAAVLAAVVGVARGGVQDAGSGLLMW